MDRIETTGDNTEPKKPSLCSPGEGLACFACCPPIRPAGYDHWPFRSSLRRLFVEARADYLAGKLPTHQSIGFSCPGLGFLDSKGRMVGCLLHPAVNSGNDLRDVTGYRDKCRRETCPESRAFDLLDSESRALMLRLCGGMDSFEFSSRMVNPIMKLLSLGPRVTKAVFSLGVTSPENLASLALIDQVDPNLAWLAGLAAEFRGPHLLSNNDLYRRLSLGARKIRQALEPVDPLDRGHSLASLCDEWEARFWRTLLGRRRATPAERDQWRELALNLVF